jgi:hypothetical protein
MSENTQGIIILLAIIALAAFGGMKKTNDGYLSSSQPLSQEQQRLEIERKIKDTETQVEILRQQVEKENNQRKSTYEGTVSLYFLNRSTDPSKEYLAIKVNGTSSKISLAGWTIKNISSNEYIDIPQSAYISESNTKDNLVLSSGDVLYITTGNSPLGYSFAVNKCSGYLSQSMDITPSLKKNCPIPTTEYFSLITSIVENTACFNYINSLKSCEIPTDLPPITLSNECKNFISTKINYPSCVDAHMYDADFYSKEWRIYLKQIKSIWINRHDTIILYDSLGKIVDTFRY